MWNDVRTLYTKQLIMIRVQYMGITVMILFMGLFANDLRAQDKKEDKQALIENLVAARNFVFKVQTVQPTF